MLRKWALSQQVPVEIGQSTRTLTRRRDVGSHRGCGSEICALIETDLALAYYVLHAANFIIDIVIYYYLTHINDNFCVYDNIYF